MISICRVRPRYDQTAHTFKYDRPWWYLGGHHYYEVMLVFRRAHNEEDAWLPTWGCFSDHWLSKWFCPCGAMNRSFIPPEW